MGSNSSAIRRSRLISSCSDTSWDNSGKIELAFDSPYFSYTISIVFTAFCGDFLSVFIDLWDFIDLTDFWEFMDFCLEVGDLKLLEGEFNDA